MKKVFGVMAGFSAGLWPGGGIWWKLLSPLVGGGAQESFLFPLYGGMILLAGIAAGSTVVLYEKVSALEKKLETLAAQREEKS